MYDDGHRNGLNGGNRDNGGAVNVDNDHRDNRNDNLGVRVVLSLRNSQILTYNLTYDIISLYATQSYSIIVFRS